MSRQFPLPPNSDPAFASLADPRMYWPVQYARLQASLREGFQARVGVPFERLLLHWWQQDGPGSRWVERRGLPRRAVEHAQGDSLVVRVNPRELLRIRDWRGLAKQQRPSSSTFIWEGDWDLRRGDLRQGSRYRFISDLVAHRDNLDGSGAFSHFNARLVAGHPWSSHQQGLLLDSETRILTFLRVYLQFMDDMACNGFDYHKPVLFMTLKPNMNYI